MGGKSYITDINTINKELKQFEEIEIPYILKNGTKIKYITAINNEEVFSNGGEFVKMGNERIFLRNGPYIWSVPTKLRDNNSNIIYKSRFFIKNIKNANKEIIKLQQIINAQQKVIKKMTKNIENLNIELNNSKKKNIEYEKYINKIKNNL